MKKPKEATPQASSHSPSPDDLAFELEVARRHPTRKITRFDFPASVEDATAVYMFELTAADELIAAENTDAIMSSGGRSFTVAAEVEMNEAIKLSICAIVNADGGRRHVDQGVNIAADVDNWSARAWRVLRSSYGELNGLSAEDLGKAKRSARKIGPPTPPIERPLPAPAE